MVGPPAGVARDCRTSSSPSPRGATSRTSPAERFDLVLAVDSFPYVHQAGPEVVETYFHEAARVLGPGGEFVILHFSYRDSTEADRAEVRKLCRAAGFTVVMNGAQPFKLWDGVAFRMRKG